MVPAGNAEGIIEGDIIYQIINYFPSQKTCVQVICEHIDYTPILVQLSERLSRDL